MTSNFVHYYTNNIAIVVLNQFVIFTEQTLVTMLTKALLEVLSVILAFANPQLPIRRRIKHLIRALWSFLQGINRINFLTDQVFTV